MITVLIPKVLRLFLLENFVATSGDKNVTRQYRLSWFPIILHTHLWSVLASSRLLKKTLQ